MKTKNKEKIFLILIFIIFIFLAFVTGLKHEHWLDEAQAWLIARDTSLYSLFTKYLHSDGHPALWHLVLKIFQLFKFKYRDFYLIPIIFSSLGIYLFLFKSSFKWYIKLLIPFTYFIFYQYTIVARGYCLVFFLMGLLATVWDKRDSKPLLISLILVLLINSEAYTLIFAGSIYLYLLIEFFKQKDFKNKYKIISYIIIFFSFIITLLYVHPISSNTVIAGGSNYNLVYSFFITSYMNYFIVIVSLLLLAILLCIYLFKNKKECLTLLLLVIPNYIFNIYFYCNIWHYGIIFLIFIFFMWAFKLTNNKYLNLFLLICAICQVTWNISAVIYDYNNVYSPASEAADFIKNYDYKHLKIYGLTFNDTAINPYFNENIYDNWEQDISFFYLNTKSVYYKYDYTTEGLLKDNPDMIVFSTFYTNYNFDDFKDEYNYYEFHGYSRYACKNYEDQTIIIYVKKSIDNKCVFSK